MAKQQAAETRKGSVRAKKATKRKRFGKTGATTRQAKISQRAAGTAKQARNAARSRFLGDIRSLAGAAVEALDAGDLDTVRSSLLAIAGSGNK